MAEKLVIFDCDGVLVDSEILMSQVFSRALSEYGYHISTEDSIRRFTGVNEHMCREIIMKESGIDIPKDFWDLQKPNLQKAYKLELSPLLQPVLELLENLKIPRCVASNSSKDHIITSLEITKQLKYFARNAIFSSEQVLKPKPFPDLFLHAANEMKALPEHCIVIEDSFTGAQAAISAGMNVLLYLGGSHARFEWYQSQIATHNMPMFSTCEELSQAIKNAIGKDI